MKWLSYILLSVVFFLAIGTSGFFFWQLHQIKSSVNKEFAGNEHTNLLSLRFNQKAFSELNWIEKGKEFSFAGKMYDVFSVQEEGNMVTVYCSYDTRETQLRKTFENLLSGSSTKGLPLRQLVKIIGQKYLQELFTNTFLPPTGKQIIFKPYAFSVVTNYIESEEHPPQFLF